MNPISRAISIVGSASALAKELGVTPQAVCFWRDGDRQIPADICPSIERITKRDVQCEELRPDVEWSVIRHTRKKAS